LSFPEAGKGRRGEILLFFFFDEDGEEEEFFDELR
jgi:hypothetical protein